MDPSGDYVNGVHSRCCRSACGALVPSKPLWRYATCGSIFVAIITIVVLLVNSVQDISHAEMALAFYDVANNLDAEVLLEGRYFLRPDAELIRFDNKFLTHDPTIQCISRDGLEISFTVSVQYAIKKDELVDVVYNFGGSQNGLLASVNLIISDKTKDVCGKYTGQEFFNKRGEVESTLSSTLQESIQSTPSHVGVGFVQLKNIHLSTPFNTAVERKQLALEEVDVARSQREESLTRAQTTLLRAVEDRKIKLVQAGAEANALLFQARERTAAREIVWAERAKELQFGIESLGFTAKDYLEAYLFPHITAENIAPATQACLERCGNSKEGGGNDCWACWTGGAGGVASIAARVATASN